MNQDSRQLPPVADHGSENSVDLLRQVLNDLIAFVAILTPAGILTEVNDTALRATGMTRDDFIGKNLWENHCWNFDPNVKDRTRDAVTRAASGENIRFETDIVVKGGARITIDFQITPHRCGNGTVDFLVASAIDITSRVQNEKALRAAHDSFKYLVTNSPFGVYAVDADLRFAFAGAGARDVFKNVHPLIGRDFTEILRTIWPEAFVADAIGHFRKTLATGISYQAPSFTERRADTAKVESYDWKIERVTLPDGRLGVVCHFYDLTEREWHAAQLNARERQFRATFENAAVGIAHMSPDGHYLLVNRKLCDTLGYSESEMLGMRFHDVTFVDDLAPNLKLFDQMVAGEIEGYDLEKRYLTKNGSIIWAHLTVSCMRQQNGKLDCFISIIEDISQKKVIERQQKLLIDELSHRVKNILAAVQSMASHTMRTNPTMATFREKFFGRLRAIAAAHESIFEQGEMRAELASVVLKQLAPYAADGSDRLRMSGPKIYISAASAHALGLIIHEMATNASKYGALANSVGYISVSWEQFTQSEKEMARLIWREIDGPPVTPPHDPGFGSLLITTTLEHSLGGTCRTKYLADGLVAELTFFIEDTRNG